MSAKEEVAEILLKIGAVALRPKDPFKYTSGILSPIYCDNRLLMSYVGKRRKMIDYFLQAIEENNLDFDIIAGVATGGIPHAAWVAEKLDKPMVYIRGGRKKHGKENKVEGKLEKGQKVLVLEDLVSTGGSSVEAIETVREAGGIVEDCVAIFTYQLEKARKNFEEAEVKLISLTEFSTLVKVAEEEDYISSEEKETVLQWNKDPENWGKKMGFD